MSNKYQRELKRKGIVTSSRGSGTDQALDAATTTSQNTCVGHTSLSACKGLTACHIKEGKQEKKL